MHLVPAYSAHAGRLGELQGDLVLKA